MSATPEQITERLDRVRHAMLDWAEDFRRMGSIDGEMSEKSRAHLLGEAAALIRAQAERVRVLEEALKPFAAAANEFDDAPEDQWQEAVFWADGQTIGYRLTVGDTRRARAALNADGAA